MKTNSDITIFNKHVDPTTRGEVWQRTQIVGVTWENSKAANVLRSGLIEADKVAVYIPYARGASYLSPRAWQALSVKTGRWTLQAGDVLVRGLISEDIDADYTISNLKAEYDDVMVVRSVDLMDAGSQALWHWQVGAA